MSVELSSFIVRLLLKYFRKGEKQAVSDPQVNESDRRLLRLQWSCSRTVRTLCEYLRSNPHELHAALGYRTVTASGTIRGRIRAAETVLAQARAADPSTFVYDEPFRSYDNGPNRVLGWTTAYAMRLAREFRSMLTADATYYQSTEDALRMVESARHLLPVPESKIVMPSSPDVRAARGSRLQIYRLAAEAYDDLRKIEDLDRLALEVLLSDTLVGPMERWRQFELALTLAMGEAVARRTNREMVLKTIVVDAGKNAPIVEVGDYALRWQLSGSIFRKPALEKWEQREWDIMDEYDVAPGAFRPDVVLYRTADEYVIAIGEAKYFEGLNWKNALRDAVGQVVTYARGYEHAQTVDDLIGRSLIALWELDQPTPRAKTATTPFVTTFAEMQRGLDDWALRAI